MLFIGLSALVLLIQHWCKAEMSNCGGLLCLGFECTGLRFTKLNVSTCSIQAQCKIVRCWIILEMNFFNPSSEQRFKFMSLWQLDAGVTERNGVAPKTCFMAQRNTPKSRVSVNKPPMTVTWFEHWLTVLHGVLTQKTCWCKNIMRQLNVCVLP